MKIEQDHFKNSLNYLCQKCGKIPKICFRVQDADGYVIFCKKCLKIVERESEREEIVANSMEDEERNEFSH